MRVLLDTHTLLWWYANDSKLSRKAAGAINNPDCSVFVSAVSAWEISNKWRAKRLLVSNDLLGDFEATMASQDFQTLPVTTRHVYLGGQFVSGHKDPFDRLLAAQARLENLALISCDEKMNELGINVLW